MQNNDAKPYNKFEKDSDEECYDLGKASMYKKLLLSNQIDMYFNDTGHIGPKACKANVKYCSRKSQSTIPVMLVGFFGDYVLGVLDWFRGCLCDSDGSQANFTETVS